MEIDTNSVQCATKERPVCLYGEKQTREKMFFRAFFHCSFARLVFVVAFFFVQRTIKARSGAFFLVLNGARWQKLPFLSREIVLLCNTPSSTVLIGSLVKKLL